MEKLWLADEFEYEHGSCTHIILILKPGSGNPYQDNYRLCPVD